MPIVTATNTRDLLKNSSDPKLRELASDGELVVALAAVLNVSLEIAEEFPQSKGELAGMLIKKGAAVSGVVGTATKSRGLETANFMVSQSLKSIGLLKVAGMTPNKAAAYITLTMAEKVVSAAGMGNIGKCKLAVATLAMSTGGAAFVCVGSLGIGCAAGAIAVAADAFNYYEQCHKGK